MLQKLPNIHVKNDEVARRIVAHWQRVIGENQVEQIPYQHLYAKQIWPDDVYDQMLSLLPGQELYRPLNIKQWVNAEGISTRDKCYPSETIDRMSPEQAEFWGQIVLALTSRSFKELIFRKFSQDISLRLKVAPDEVNHHQIYVGISLTRDIADYRLKPHPDGHPRVVTGQFYLPKDESQSDLGTSIYEKNPLFRSLSGKRFRETKRMPFLPNSGYAFAVNDCKERQSFHGRELIKTGSGVRNSILVTWLSENAEAKRAPLWPIHDKF